MNASVQNKIFGRLNDLIPTLKETGDGELFAPAKKVTEMAVYCTVDEHEMGRIEVEIAETHTRGQDDYQTAIRFLVDQNRAIACVKSVTGRTGIPTRLDIATLNAYGATWLDTFHSYGRVFEPVHH